MSAPGSYTWKDRIEEYLGPNWQAVITVGVILTGLLVVSILTGGCHPDKMIISQVTSRRGGGLGMGDIVIMVALIAAAYIGYIKYYRGEKIKLGEYEL